ncbi:MAG TPA: molybdopterin-dependent oxidoreductase [Bacteroidales bacterium]|nr:molybdopterin-dependent oxidoreductase [Bacteroidales bacterium]
MINEFLTVCPRNCYSTCSFRVFVKDGKVERILSYEGNLATPEGPCIKGFSYLEREFSPKRIIHPLKRNSTGGFDTISIEEALEITAHKLLEAREQHGPLSVFFYQGSGNSGLSNDIATIFWKLFGGATTTYGNLCWPAGLEAVRLTLGEVKHNVPWDLTEAQLIIMWGKNPAETNVQEMIHIDRALKKGARLVVIDPRRTLTADKADLLIRPLPGTDGALALALARVLVDRKLTDESFIRKKVTGYDRFVQSLDITPARAEEITGVPAQKIEELALMIGRTDKVTVVAGYGLQRYTNGGQTIRSILSIPVITGKIGRSGCGFNFSNLQGYIYDNEKEPLSYYPDAVNDMPFRRKISMAKFAEGFFNLDPPAVKVAWIERGNPLTQLPDSSGVRKAFESVPFKVVVDQFLTDTARMADIILPAKGIFEQSDVISSYWNPYIQFKPKVTDPPGDVMPESEIYFRLAERMNLCGTEKNPIPPPGNDNFEKWLTDRISSNEQITLDDLRKGPVMPFQIEEIAYNDLRFPTPSGKIELYSEVAAQKWKVNPLPSYVSLDIDDDNKLPFRLMSPNIGSRIHSQFGNLEVIKSVTESQAWEISPTDARGLGIKSGDKILISNGRGAVTGTARVTNRVKRGSIVFPNGIWLEEGGGVNTLIAPAETDMGYGAAFHNTGVNVEKAEI